VGPSHPASADSVPIVATEAVEAAWEHVIRGPGHLLLVGAPGAGKSTTLRAIEERARDAGLPVGWVGPTLDPAATLASGTDPAPRLHLLDDAHLLPAESLEELLRRVEEGGGRLVAATRPGAGASGTGALPASTRGTRTVVLEAWSEAEVAALLALHPGFPGTPGDIVVATAALPWLVVDTVEAAAEPTAGGRPAPGGDPTPSGGPVADRHVLRLLREVPDLDADVLLSLAAGYPSHGDPLPPPLRGLDSFEVRRVVDRLWHSGLVGADGVMPVLVRQSLVRTGPPHRIREMLSELVNDLTGTGADLREIARNLAELGLRDPRVANALAEEAARQVSRDPGAAARLYSAAIEAGGDVASLGVRHAETLALAGDVGAAGDVLSDLPDGESSPRAVRVGAALAVLSGSPWQAAQIARRALVDDAVPVGDSVGGCAALALLGVGDLPAADLLLARVADAPRGFTPSPLPEMANAVRLSIGAEADRALPALARASTTEVPGRRRPLLLPDTPATLAALVALHVGDLALAESALAEAASASHRPLPVEASRVSALRGWICMLSGRYADARVHVEEIDPRVPRDAPWAWGLRLGLARRQDDVRALTAVWAQARSVLVGHPVDLYSLLPLGEIGLAAARMHEPQLATPIWDEAVALLTALGDPPLWGSPFHWYAVQAAILTDRPDAVAPHARALMAGASSSRMSATLAGAGKVWVSVLARDVDPVGVSDAARALAAVGQAWEGARLAAHGAARAADRKDAALLLECARDLLGPSSRARSRDAEPGGGPSADGPGTLRLTGREREVAHLVLAGLTYQQIGGSLFLSARTVEHHVARIKRRCGARTRSELLERLAVTLSDSTL